MSDPTPEAMRRLWDICEAFIDEQKISCVESICQCDWVIEGAYDFIGEVCEVVGYHQNPEDVLP